MQTIVLISVAVLLTFSQGGLTSNVITTFLNDNAWVNDAPRPSPVDLGSFPYQCVGNVNLCPTGFTLSLWYQPDTGNAQLQYQYVLSTGGQSAVSEGIYFRRVYGQNFQIGVSVGTKTWVVPFYLINSAWTNVVLSFSQSTGLSVYVDGLLVGQDTSGEPRVASLGQFEQFTDIVVGQANDVENLQTSNGQITIWNIEHVDTLYTASELTAFLTAVPNSLLIDCGSTQPAIPGLVPFDDSTSQGSLNACRAQCFAQQLNIAVFSQNQLCGCVSTTAYEQWLASNSNWGSQSCPSGGLYSVQWASHVNFSPTLPSVALQVTTTNPTKASYVLPGQTIVFNLAATPASPVTFNVDFSDGSLVVTTDTSVSHSWASVGSYIVNVTAIYMTSSTTQLIPITITYVNQAQVPQQLSVSTSPNLSPSSQPETSNIFLTAYSVDTMTCSIEYGDQSTFSFQPVTASVFIDQEQHQYPMIGFYNVSVSCANDAGVTSANQIAVVANQDAGYVSQARGSTIMIPIVGTSASSNPINVLVDNANVAQSAGVTQAGSTVQIADSVFGGQDGEHTVVVQTPSGTNLWTEVYNLLNPVQQVSVVATASAPAGQAVSIAIIVSGGDAFHLNISYGDGTYELVYIPDSSPASTTTVSRSYTYSALGQYVVMATVANDVSIQTAQQTIFIEQPLMAASFSGTNVTALGTATVFTFTIDASVVSTVSIVLDYDDGNKATIASNSLIQITPGTYTYAYTYQTYGIYNVFATIQNQLSSIAMPPVLVQVGQNITLVDVYVQQSLIAIGQSVVLTVSCPTGSPVALSVNMGDGQPAFTVSRPTSYTSSQNNAYVRPASVSSANNRPASAGAGRKKRQVNTASYSYIISTNQNFVITYTYKTSGTFSVSVNATNMFSWAASRLCPSIVVVPTSAPAPKCTNVAASITSAAPLSSPMSTTRSSVISLTATTNMACSGGLASTTFVPGYTWTVERLVAVNTWRPELTVCATDMSSQTLTVPSDTLWYTTYRFNVTVVANAITTGGNGSPQPTLLASATPASTYVTVTPSPLDAVIDNGGQSVYMTSQVVNMNLTMSGDPDVPVANKTGLQMYLFCYAQSMSSVYGVGLSLKQMLSMASLISENIEQNTGVYQFPKARCFLNTSNTWTLEYDIVISASDLIVSDSVNFILYVTKDTRVATTTVNFQVITSSGTSNPLDSINELLKNGNTNGALLVINMVTGTLNSNTTNSSAVQAQSDLRTQLITCIGHVANNIQNMDQVAKTVDVTGSVTSVPSQVTSTSKANATAALGTTAQKVLTLAGSSSVGTVANITKSMLGSLVNTLPFNVPVATPEPTTPATTSSRRKRSALLSKMLKKTPEVVPTVNETSCCGNLSGLCDWIEPVDYRGVSDLDRKSVVWTEEICLQQYPCELYEIEQRYELYLQDQVDAANALKAATTASGMGVVSNMGSVLVTKHTGTTGQTALSSGSMNLTVSKINPSAGSVATSDYILPSSVQGCGAVHLVSPNAYTFGASSDLITGNTKSLSLTDCAGNPIEVNNLDAPITIWMNSSSTSGLPSPQNYTLLNSTGNNINYVQVNLTANNSAVFAVIVPSGLASSYYVYLKYQTNTTDMYPNATFYDWVGETPVPGVTDPLLMYTVYPPQNVTALNGTYRFGIQLKESIVGADSLVASLNYTYSMYTFSTGCRFFNTTSGDWGTDGCVVGPQTTYEATECLCTHLTSFGSSFAVQPNMIDFNTVFTLANFLQSMPVFMTVVVIIIIYIVLLVWARHMDKKDIVRWGAMPLEDNLPTDHYHYQLSVYTAVRKSAGTSSKPSFILSGDNADTGVRRLSDGKRKTLPAGSIYNYVLSVENCLGPLSFLRIWHDNSGQGSNKGWYLDQLHITDIQTGERYFFVCDRWLAVDQDDGMVERIIPVAGTGDLTQFKNLFTHSIRKKFSNDHMWLSVFSRPTRSTFTRVQRISCCVSLLFLTMITNCMFFKSTDPSTEMALHIGPITITAQQIYISVISTCIVMPPSVAIVTIFHHVRPKKNAIQQVNQLKNVKWRSINPGSALWNNEEQPSRIKKLTDTMKNIVSFHQRDKYKEGAEAQDPPKKKKKKPMTFPWWTLFIAYALVFLSIVVSGFFTILYSMQWGSAKADAWLTTFFLSFFQNVIIVQPIKVVALAALLSCVLRKPDLEEEEGPTDENHLKPDEEFVNHSERDLQEIIRMRQMAHAESSRPDPEVLRKSRELQLKEQDINRIIKDCIIYLIFIIVLYFISYQDKDQRSFNFSQGIQNTFLGGNPSYGNIHSIGDMYTWLNVTLLPAMFSSGWYNGQPPATWRDALKTEDMVTIRLGAARLRQLRINEDSCKIQKSFHGLIHHCRSDYNWVDDDTNSYMANWTEALSETDAQQALINDTSKSDSWLYRDSILLQGAPYTGQIATYKGAGYTFNFHCSYEKTVAFLDQLEQDNWLDMQTRAVFLEFTLYNANVDLYGTMIMLVEFPANGGALTSYNLMVFRLTNYDGAYGAIVLLFQVIFVGFIIYFMIHIINMVRKQKLAYFKNFFNVLDFLTTVMSIICIAMYAMKIVMGNMAMSIVEKTASSQYVNFTNIGMWDSMYSTILAAVVFLSTIKFLRMLKFNRRLSILTATVSRANRDLKSFVITFFIYFFSFAMLAYLLFGTQMIGYSSFVNSIETLFCTILRAFDFNSLKSISPILGPTFFFFYNWLIVFGMQTMFLVIIIEAFQVVRAENKGQFERSEEFEVGDYLLRKFKAMFGMK